jgi:hypothetical protein
MFGGIVKYLDLSLKRSDIHIKISTLCCRGLIAGFSSLTFCLLIFDYESLTPYQKMGLSTLVGYGGTTCLDNIITYIPKFISAFKLVQKDTDNSSMEEDNNDR